MAPDDVVHIQRDVKEEHDGPMLTHGLKEMDGQRILVPRAASLRPKQVSGGVACLGRRPRFEPRERANRVPMVPLASFCLCPPAERRLSSAPVQPLGEAACR